MICAHEEFSLFVSIVDHSLAHGRRQLEPFGLAGWVTLQGIAEGLPHFHVSSGIIYDFFTIRITALNEVDASLCSCPVQFLVLLPLLHLWLYAVDLLTCLTSFFVTLP